MSTTPLVTSPVSAAFAEDATGPGLQAKLRAIMADLAASTTPRQIAAVEVAGVGDGNRFVATVLHAAASAFTPPSSGIAPTQNVICYRGAIGGPPAGGPYTGAVSEFYANRSIALAAAAPPLQGAQLVAVASGGASKGLDAMNVEVYTTLPTP
jgi:hypothetical protein